MMFLARVAHCARLEISAEEVGHAMEGEPVLALSWTLQKAEELRQRLGYWRERLHLSSSSASASCAGDGASLEPAAAS